jgi:hypothetical protein
MRRRSTLIFFFRASLCALACTLSCSDPVSPPAQGAASLQWTTSTLNSKTPQCVPGPHWSNAPVAASDQAENSANAVSGGLVVDGQVGGHVTCSVIQRGQGYVVSGEIQTATPDGTRFTDVAVNVTIDGENEAQGTLYITDDLSQVTFSSDTAIIPPKPGCTFSASAASGRKLGVGPGWLWASVQCPHVNDNRNRAAQECEIASGIIVLRDCLRE